MKKLLPVLSTLHAGVRGKRSAVTCALKCDNACSKAVCNTSSNGYFRDIASAAMDRRAVLGLGAAAAVTIGVASAAGAPTAAHAKPGAGKAFTFAPIDPVHHEVDAFVVPEGFTWEPVARWGDRLFPDAPTFDIMKQTPEAQARQFGYNNDFTEFQIVPGTNGKRAVMFCNHEYTNDAIMFPEDFAEETKRAIARNAHGFSVVELTRKNANKPWRIDVGGAMNRRYLLDTEYRVTGPAAGSDLLRTRDDDSGTTILGTFGNCAGGLTPWGTLLSGEENFDGYFVAKGDTPEQQRYGLNPDPSQYGWEKDLARFDASGEDYANEVNRFGWIVEVDPWDPTSTPRKHTNMGRFKHEGANVTIAKSGHAVAYMGDDERFDYLYKFVSRNTYREGDRAHNMTLLEEGDLYVAKFEGTSAAEIDGSGTLPADGSFDGTGTWLPLLVDGKSQVPGMDAAEVAVHTRLAADKVGPTKMDRCEDVEPNHATGRIYVACTNNKNRGLPGYAVADETNPRTDNRDGHVVEILESDDDHTGTSFRWNLLLVCGDPKQGDATYFGGFPVDQVSPISCPDNLAFDSTGNLWISTDGAPDGIGYGDGLFKVTLNGAQRGKVEQFLSVPAEGEVCGPVVHDDIDTITVSVQHPGEDGSFAEQHSSFPDYVSTNSTAKGLFAAPRPAVIQVLPGKPAKNSADARGRAAVGDIVAGDTPKHGRAI